MAAVSERARELRALLCGVWSPPTTPSAHAPSPAAMLRNRTHRATRPNRDWRFVARAPVLEPCMPICIPHIFNPLGYCGRDRLTQRGRGEHFPFILDSHRITHNPHTLILVRFWTQ